MVDHRILRVAVFAAVGGWLTAAMAQVAPREEEPARPASWAAALDWPGVPNLHRVSPVLYRSAQPTAAGMRRLKKEGVVTVVNLRSFHSDREELGDTGLGYEHLTVKAWHPEEKELMRFLEVVADPQRTPVLLHCQHGSDRTGAMCAAYRVVVQGWTKDEAIREMTDGGYGFSPVWANLRTWVQELEVERLRKSAGIEAPAAAPSNRP